jgi:hypothetical protein
MNPEQMIEHMKGLGLSKVHRSIVMNTYREEGEVEALAHAARILAKEQQDLQAARTAANNLFGMSL